MYRYALTSGREGPLSSPFRRLCLCIHAHPYPQRSVPTLSQHFITGTLLSPPPPPSVLSASPPGGPCPVTKSPVLESPSQCQSHLKTLVVMHVVHAPQSVWAVSNAVAVLYGGLCARTPVRTERQGPLLSMQSSHISLLPLSRSLLLFQHQGWLISRNPVWESTSAARSPMAQGLDCYMWFPSLICRFCKCTTFASALCSWMCVPGGHRGAHRCAQSLCFKPPSL